MKKSAIRIKAVKRRFMDNVKKTEGGWEKEALTESVIYSCELSHVMFISRDLHRNEYSFATPSMLSWKRELIWKKVMPDACDAWLCLLFYEFFNCSERVKLFGLHLRNDIPLEFLRNQAAPVKGIFWTKGSSFF